MRRGHIAVGYVCEQEVVLSKLCGLCDSLNLVHHARVCHCVARSVVYLNTKAFRVRLLEHGDGIVETSDAEANFDVFVNQQVLPFTDNVAYLDTALSRKRARLDPSSELFAELSRIESTRRGRQ